MSAAGERSSKIKKNIVLLFIYKGAAVAINLALVPLTLTYLDASRYGIWLTLSSIIGWIYLFDIGLGNGLRNRFAEASAVNDKNTAGIYISTTYAMLSVIAVLLVILFFIINPFLNWSAILNAPAELSDEISLLVVFVFIFFCAGLILRLINTILTADQRPAISNLILTLGALLSIAGIFLLNEFTAGSLILAGVVLSFASILPSGAASLYYFAKDYKDVRPRISNVKLSYFNQLMGLGFKFFIIQIAFLVIFTTSNIIISHLFGPAEVTTFNISFKYFSSVTMVVGIITAPFWSAYTEAFVKKDFVWIKTITAKLIKIFYLITAVVILMIIFSDIVYSLWVGDEISVPFSLSLITGIYVLVFSWNTIFVNFINGVGKIKLQVYSSVISGIAIVPFALLLGKQLGLPGVMLAVTIAMIPGTVLVTIQYYKIINGTAKGIWNK